MIVNLIIIILIVLVLIVVNRLKPHIQLPRENV